MKSETTKKLFLRSTIETAVEEVVGVERQRLIGGIEGEMKEAFLETEASFILGTSSLKQKLVVNREQFWLFLLENLGEAKLNQ